MRPECFFSDFTNKPTVAVGEKLTPQQAMTLAIAEAYRGTGFVSPNPLVGCVIVDHENRFLVSGFHAQVGKAHAEAQALENLKLQIKDHANISFDELQNKMNEKLKGATVYVTLEPCAHQGRTPSCAKTLAQYPIAQVVYGLQDPNPLVAGQGAEILRQAGIRANVFSELFFDQQMTLDLEQVAEHFLWNFRKHKVFFSLKVASSLDGQMALQSGESKWITNEKSRQISHVLRAAHDAVMIGAGTYLQDDPSLNIRVQGLENKKMKVIVLDAKAQALKHFLLHQHTVNLAKAHSPENIYFVVDQALQAEISKLLSDNKKVELQPQVIWTKSVYGSKAFLNELDQSLWSHKMRSVFVEGGAKVLSSFIREMSAQRLYLFQAPIILGAKSGRAWSEQVSIDSMKERISIHNIELVRLEQDTLIMGRFQE